MKDRTHEECMGTVAEVHDNYIACVVKPKELTEQEKRYLEWKEKRDKGE